MNDLTKELQAMSEAQQSSLAENLKEINQLAHEAFEAKNAATAAEDVAKNLKSKLSALMETAGVDKISADNCTVSGKIKASASVPKEDASKLALFAYLMSLDNTDGNGTAIESEAIKELCTALTNYPTFLSMLTINPTSFNSWYAKEMQAKIDSGNITWKLPFVSTYEYYSIGFRKKAGKA